MSLPILRRGEERRAAYGVGPFTFGSSKDANVVRVAEGRRSTLWKHARAQLIAKGSHARMGTSLAL
jgi:hypothetical protein